MGTFQAGAALCTISQACFCVQHALYSEVWQAEVLRPCMRSVAIMAFGPQRSLLQVSILVAAALTKRTLQASMRQTEMLRVRHLQDLLPSTVQSRAASCKRRRRGAALWLGSRRPSQCSCSFWWGRCLALRLVRRQCGGTTAASSATYSRRARGRPMPLRCRCCPALLRRCLPQASTKQGGLDPALDNQCHWQHFQVVSCCK